MDDYQQNFMNALHGGYDFGAKIKAGRDRTNFNRLAGQAYSAPEAQRPDLLGQMATLNPQGAQAQQKAYELEDERRNQSIVNMARLLTSAPEEARPALWKTFAQELPRLGMTDFPTDYNDQSSPVILGAAKSIVDAYGDLDKTVPSGLREFDGLTQGLTPEQKEEARLIRLGLKGRAATGGYGFELVEGPDGKTRLQRRNPRDGGVEIYDEVTREFVPIGGAAPAATTPAPAPAAWAPPRVGAVDDNSAIAQRLQAFSQRVQSMGLTPEQQVALMDAYEQEQNLVMAPDTGSPSAPAASAAAPAPAPARTTNSALFGPSRTKEEEAAAVAEAQAAVQLRNMPTVENIKTEAELERARELERIKREGAIATKDADRARDANSVLDLVDRAEKLVKQSTGSGLGAARDSGAAYFGQSTKGGEAIAALRVLSGQLVGKMPRMEGPQSDADRLMYQQMAGDLANPNVPVPQRLAALQTIRALNTKYAEQQPAPTAPRVDDRRRALLDKY